ncbi:Ig-like domain repeat protein [Chloroflexota bacterium]
MSKIFKRCSFIICLVLIMLLAAVIIPASGVYAAPSLQESHDGSNDFWWTPRGSIWLGQTFTAISNHSVTSVKFNILFVNGTPGDIYVYLMAIDGGIPTGGYLATAVRSSYSAGWQEWTFSTPFVVTDQVEYALVISAPDSDDSNNINVWMENSPGTYGDGHSILSMNGGASWSSSTTGDMDFEVYGELILATYGGHYYAVVDNGSAITWTASRDAAADLGPLVVGGRTYFPHLATINSGGEQTFIEGLDGSDTWLWLGGTDAASEGAWTWITGEPFIYTHWAAGEPNQNTEGEDYLEWNAGAWNDNIVDSGRVVGYIVEYEPILSNVIATPDTIDENSTTTVSGTITDPGTLGAFTVTIDWGDGTTEGYSYSAGSPSFSETHQYLDDNPTATSSDNYTVTVTVKDDDTSVDVDSETTSVTVNNVFPTLSNVIATPATIDENGTTTVSGDITEPGTQDTFTVTIDWGEGSPVDYSYSAGSTSFSETHQYLDDNPTGTPSDIYTITVTVTDDDTGTDTDSTSVTVNNVPPVVEVPYIAYQPNPNFILPVVDNVKFEGVFSDIGTLDTHTAKWTWGDGSTSIGAVDESGGSGKVSGSHTFALPGLYRVMLTVTDDDTGVHSNWMVVQVVDLATTTRLYTLVNPSVYGQRATLQAIITTIPSSAVKPTGTVVFKDLTKGTTLGSVKVLSGQALLTTWDLSVGSHIINATYQPDVVSFKGSASSSVTQIVNKSPTTTSLTSSTNPSTYGQLVYFTATVRPGGVGSGRPTGTVTFKDLTARTTLGTATLNSSGMAKLSTNLRYRGTHTIVAVYSGNGNFNGSTSYSLNQRVN